MGEGGRRTRRAILAAGSAVSLAACAGGHLHVDATTELGALEAGSGGRLGVGILDTQSGRFSGWRASERFGMCSTFKLALAGLILREIDAGRLSADLSLPLTASDVVSNSPVVEGLIQTGAANVLLLAEATQVQGDNAAANLLLRLIGGPEGYTKRLRDIGDVSTRLDRFEPDLNFVPPGDERDTTTPRAMASTLSKFVTGNVLDRTSRALISEWMIKTQTGPKRLRAATPAGWSSGDKTGSGIADGMPNKYNDIAVFWPPKQSPIAVAAYYESGTPSETLRDEDQAVLAEVGRIAVRWSMGR